jgi:hypothetical protein
MTPGVLLLVSLVALGNVTLQLIGVNPIKLMNQSYFSNSFFSKP